MKKSFYFILYFFSILYTTTALGQDSLKLKDMQQFSYPFTLEQGVFHGKGAEVLTTAIANSHITMLGDNNRSALESEFTNALIDELERHQYKTMVLEVGPGSGKVIQEMTQIPDQTTSNLKALNQEYALPRTANILAPIPDFKSIEAAQFLQNAAEKDWALLAIGTDTWTSYRMLVDELFNNLSAANQGIHQALYHSVRQHLDTLYARVPKQTNAELSKFMTALKSAGILQQFLDKMDVFSQNQVILEAFHFSLNYWELYGQRDFYTKNKQQAKRNKVLLTQLLQKEKFDFQEEKLFLKMYTNHLAKGTTTSGFYGVGNMLHEMAEYHGNTSLNIAIARRFYEVEGEIKDIIEAPNFKYLNFQELIPLGQKEEWVVVDLRQFNKAFFWEGFKMSTAMHKILLRYDLLVIPKADMAATNNY